MCSKQSKSVEMASSDQVLTCFRTGFACFRSGLYAEFSITEIVVRAAGVGVGCNLVNTFNGVNKV